MVVRIIPKTSDLSRREYMASCDLRSLFPDGVVVGLDSKDKALGKRLSTLYVSLGYESRSDLIEALGFTVRSSKGGRPSSVDPSALMLELERRYKGKSKPVSIRVLIEENPDLKGQIKTVSNKAKVIFGHTFANELSKRGILNREISGSKSSLTDEEILDGVEELVRKYSGAVSKCKTLGVLARKDLEAGRIIDALSGKRSRELLGTTVADYFKKHGILDGGSTVLDDSEIEAAVNALSKLMEEIPDEEKPTSIAALCSSYPEYSEQIKSGQKRGLLTRDSLTERGVLGLTKAARAAKEKLMRERCVRNASVEDLVRLYRSCGGSALVRPGEEAEIMRPGVIGLDVASGCELRESTLLSFKAAGVRAGEVLDVRYPEGGDDAGSHTICVSCDGNEIIRSSRQDRDSFLSIGPCEVDSDLAAFAECMVSNVEHAGAKAIVRMRYRFLMPLSVETMLYALKQMGAISNADLLGGDSWRKRIECASSSSVMP